MPTSNTKTPIADERLMASLAAIRSPEFYFQNGLRYQKAFGVPKDLGEAAAQYKIAAEREHAEAQYRLGTFLEKGVGVDRQDPAKAVAWYRRAAEQGHASAQYKLGTFLYNGIGTEKNSSEAIYWLCKAELSGVGGARDVLQKRSCTGKYDIAFRESDMGNIPLTTVQIIDVITAMKRIGRAKSNASTIIGNLVKFSVDKKAIKTTNDLDLILENIGRDSELDIGASKACLMIENAKKSCITLRPGENPVLKSFCSIITSHARLSGVGPGSAAGVGLLLPVSNQSVVGPNPIGMGPRKAPSR